MSIEIDGQTFSLQYPSRAQSMALTAKIFEVERAGSKNRDRLKAVEEGDVDILDIDNIPEMTKLVSEVHSDMIFACVVGLDSVDSAYLLMQASGGPSRKNPLIDRCYELLGLVAPEDEEDEQGLDPKPS